MRNITISRGVSMPDPMATEERARVVRDALTNWMIMTEDGDMRPESIRKSFERTCEALSIEPAQGKRCLELIMEHSPDEDEYLGE
jgi:hypothetical protein